MDPNRSADQRRVVVTSSPHWFPGLEALLSGFEVSVRRRPLLLLEPREIPPDVASRLVHPSGYGAVICNSPQAAIALRALGPERLGALSRVWCAGEATATALGTLSVPIVVVAGGHTEPETAAALVGSVIAAAVNAPILLLLGEPDLPDLASRLTDAGAQVDGVPVYRSHSASDVELVATLDHAELLVVAHPDVVTALAAQGDDALLPLWVAVGRTTADRCRAAGLPLVGVSADSGAASVAQVIRQVLGSRFLLQPRDTV